MIFLVIMFVITPKTQKNSAAVAPKSGIPNGDEVNHSNIPNFLLRAHKS
jgi:hypothetical protein